MKKIFIVLTALIMAVVMLAGCSQNAATDPVKSDVPAASDGDFDPSKSAIAICTYPTSNPTVAVMAAGFMEAAEELGYQALLLGGDTTDQAVAYQDIDTAIAQYDNLKCIALNAYDEIGWKKIKDITDKGIRVCCVWNNVTDEILNEYGINREMIIGWFAPNAYNYGQAAAKDMAEKANHKGVIAITESRFNDTEDAAAKGFADYIKENEPDMSTLDPQVEGLETVAAIGTITSIIQANPEIVGAFGTTGTSAQSWAGAKEQTGWDGIIIGMDFNAQNLDLLESGKVYGIVAQPIYDAFKEAAYTCDKYLRGEDVSGWTDESGYMDSPLIHQADAAKYKELISNISVYKSVSGN